MIFHLADTDREITLDVERLLNGGYSGRDRDQVQDHIEELARIGVPAPARIPTLYPISNHLLTQSSNVQVQHARTSGEIEYVLIWAEGEVFVTVGSDQTDRELERHSVSLAKQACSNVVARDVWRLDDVQDHWDELQLRCDVISAAGRQLYQDSPLSAMLAPRDWIPVLEDRQALGDGTVFYSGTVPFATEEPVYADRYDLRLHDPHLDRSIACSYRIEVLPPALE